MFSVKRVKVTPAIYLCFIEFFHLDIQSTDSHHVNTYRGSHPPLILVLHSLLLAPVSIIHCCHLLDVVLETLPTLSFKLPLVTFHRLIVRFNSCILHHLAVPETCLILSLAVSAGFDVPFLSTPCQELSCGVNIGSYLQCCSKLPVGYVPL